MKDFDSIRDRIKEMPEGYAGYRELGKYYQDERHNVNQSYLCYEQAYALCDDDVSGGELQRLMEECKRDPHFDVNPVSIVILSYNAKDMMIDCLESIRKSCAPGSYEIVVVDNASVDGVRDYLVEQKDIILQLNDHNTSFAEGCNQGVRLANPKNDILLLNNDTIVPSFALFYLRLGLYETEKIGAVQPMSNYAIIQHMRPGNFSSREEWLENAKELQLPSLHTLENRAWLAGFALLVKRKAWELTGNLDERFVKGLCEDTDYGFRLNANGFSCAICHNAFIYHYGSVSYVKDSESRYHTLRENQVRLVQKLGINFFRYQICRPEMLDMMNPPNGTFSVLEVGCGFGHTLSTISYRYPDAYAIGLETNPIAAKIGEGVANVICANVEKDELPFEKESFDYILCPKGVDAFGDALDVMKRLKQFLKPSGKILVLQRNLMDAENFLAILSGKFETVVKKDEDAKHYYTKDETRQILSEAGLSVINTMGFTTEYMKNHPQERELLEQIGKLPGVAIAREFHIVSYIITCVKK